MSDKSRREVAPLPRGVYGSGRVEFVPNLDPTRASRVDENMTRNQPGWFG